MNETVEREIDLKDMLYRVAQKWRKIIVGAVIIALLAALLQVASGVLLILDREKLEDVRERYEVAVKAYEATGERLRARIDNLRDQSANQQEYNEKSLRMKIDPMNRWTGYFQFYIDSKYQIDPSLTYQTPDHTNRLIAAYSSYLQSAELYGEILQNTEGLDEIRFLMEVYTVTVDQSAATIRITYIGATEAEVIRLLDFIKEKIAARYPTIRDTVGDHTYEIMTESVYSVIDLELDEQQKANLLAYTSYDGAIAESTEALSEWEKLPEPRPEFGAWHTTKQAIKFLILGGILGVILMILWFAAKYIFSRSVKTDRDWGHCGIPVLGHIFRDRGNRHFPKIDAWIDRVFGRTPLGSRDETAVLTARSLEPVLKARGLTEAVLVSGIDGETGEALARTMDGAGEGIGFRLAGDILRDPEASGRLEKSGQVILLENAQSTRIEDLDQTRRLLQAWEKEILGVVVVE